jgi:hypothetical protein
MTKQILLAMACTAALGTTVAAQETVSFRSLALGGVVEDDLDLIYDPVELGYVEGTHLYTNLSNLTSGEERVFDDVADDELLIGVSGRNPLWEGLTSSALLRMRDADAPLPVMIDSDLDGFADLFGSGELEDQFHAYRDTDHDDLYDLEQTISQSRSATEGNSGFTLLLNNTKEFGATRLGLRFGLVREKTNRNTAATPLGSGSGWLSEVQIGDASIERSFTASNLVSGDPIETWSESGRFSTETEDSATHLHFAALRSLMGDYEARSEFALELVSNSTLRIHDRYSGSTETFDREVSEFLDTYGETAKYDGLRKESGNMATLGVSLRRTLEHGARRVDDGYWALAASAGHGSFDHDNTWSELFVSSERYFDGADTLAAERAIDVTTETLDEESGTRSVWTYGVSARWSKPLTSRAIFAIGGSWGCIKSTLKTDQLHSLSTSSTFREIEGTFGLNDHDTLVTERVTYRHEEQDLTKRWEVPVGLEFLLRENGRWALRLGALFSQSRVTVDSRLQVETSEPRTSTYRDGNGDLQVTVEDNVYDSVHERSETAFSSTVFSYGLGYAATENLHFDLLGFLGTSDKSILDSEFYRDLRLSVALLFD